MSQEDFESLVLKHVERGADYAETKYCVKKELNRNLTTDELRFIYNMTGD